MSLILWIVTVIVTRMTDYKLIHNFNIYMYVVKGLFDSKMMHLTSPNSRHINILNWHKKTAHNSHTWQRTPSLTFM